MKSFRLTPAAAAVAGTILVQPIHADTLDGEQVAALDPVVVTASRTARTADDTLASVSVITREDIERGQAMDLPALLDRQHGLTISRNGHFGQPSALFMRGTNSDHSLILIDGMHIGSATTGATAFEHLPLHDLERVEIVRGPRSSLYGANAIGGVVQLFTRGEDRFDGERFRGSMMAGSFGTQEITAGFDVGDGNRELSVSARKFDTDGIKVREESVDRNAYRNDSASLRYRQDVGAHAVWTVNFLHATGRTEFANTFDPDTDDFNEFLQQAVSTSLDVDLTDDWSSRLTAGQTRDELELFADRHTRTSFIDTHRDHASWQNDFVVTRDLILTAGADLMEDHVDTDSDLEEDSRYNAGAFGQALWSPGRTDFELSARRDKNEAYGYSTTGAFAAGYGIAPDLRVWGSVGTAFKAPTFNDLFWPEPQFAGGFGGNPDLEPEESVSYEVGVEGGVDLRWGINLFRTEIDDLIANETDEDGFLRPQNVDEARIHGVELTARLPDHGDWDIRASATWQDPVAKGQDGEDDSQLLRRPKRKVTLDFDRHFGRATIGSSVRHEGPRPDEFFNMTTFQTEEVELDAFTVIDLRVGYRFTERLVLRGIAENVANEDYTTVHGFNNPGRAFFLRLDYRG